MIHSLDLWVILLDEQPTALVRRGSGHCKCHPAASCVRAGTVSISIVVGMVEKGTLPQT